MVYSTCTIDGCDKKPAGRYCPMHRQRMYAHGSFDKPTRKVQPKTFCSCGGCNETVKTNGMCVKHYQAAWYQSHRDIQLAKERADRLAHPQKYRERNARYYRAHRTERLASERAKIALNPEPNRRRAREWRLAHLDQYRETKARHYREHADEIRVKHAEYYYTHRDEMVAAHRAWVHTHPIRVSLLARRAKHVRRAREAGARVTRVDLAQIIEKYGMTCHICGGAINDMTDLNFDHVIPLARGGSHSPENIRPAHEFCNKSKGACLM